MEEIKNWWGVFGLFGCVTVVSSSVERRCHRQGSLGALTNPTIYIHWHSSRECYTLAQVYKNGNACLCVLKYMCVFFFFFNGPWIKSVVFFISWLVCVFPLICTPLLSLSEAMCLVTLSSYTEPVSTPITSTTLVCWNGLRLLFIVLLLLDSSQLYSVSTVPVEPWGVTLETSVSYQHYQCSVSVDL